MLIKSLVFTVLTTISTLISAQSVSTAPNYVLDFIKNNPERSSIVFTRNDTTLAELRQNVKFPLASTMKIIIAIEYSQQAAAGKIDPEEAIPLADLDQFYVLNTDGNAHPDWIKDLRDKNLIQNEKVKLEYVAKGMIRYSSNANTEYLMDKLGIDNINENLKKLDLQNHEKLYPIVSALFLTSNSKKVEPKQFLTDLTNLSKEDYVKKCFEIHERLKTDYNKKMKNNFIFPTMDLQRVWSDRLPAGTTHEYVNIMQKINSRQYFDEKIQTHLDKLMEWALEYNPENRKTFEHLGQKGGSTAFVLTQSMYATLKNGKRMESAIFFNNLTDMEFSKLQAAMNDFNISCISSRTCYEVAKQLMGK